MTPEDTFRLLVYTAHVDGDVPPSERRLLLAFAHHLEIPSPEQVFADLRAEGPGAQLILPGEPAEQLTLFEDMIDVVLADGRVAPEERRLLDKVGAALDLKPAQIQGALESRSAAQAPRAFPRSPRAAMGKHDELPQGCQMAFGIALILALLCFVSWASS